MEPTTQCPACQREVPRDARYCTQCGESLRHPGIATASGTGLLPAHHLLNGRYVVERRLAQGGQSAVYLVRDIAAGNARRAVKEMSQAHLLPHEREHAINRFLREALMLQQLDHPMLATVYESFTEENKHYLAMEYVPGKTLEDEMIELGRPLEWEAVVRWGAALCDVLAYLHLQNPPIVYRDLKPANVMLTPDGQLKLIDFGIARRLLPARMRDTAQLGTDGYAPLEQYASKSEPRSDLYALGASLYHLLTGRVPENAPVRSSGGKLAPIRTLNPNVPEAVERVAMQAMSLHPDDRFADAPAMRAALVALLPIPASQQAPLPQPSLPAATSPASPDTAPSTQTTAQTAKRAAPGSATGRMRARTGVVQPPRLGVTPLRLDAGELDAGAVVDLEIEIENRGGGELVGEIEVSTPHIRVEPARIDSTTHLVRVTVDTVGLGAGPQGGFHLTVRSNGGVAPIPVRLVVLAPAGMRRARLPN